MPLFSGKMMDLGRQSCYDNLETFTTQRTVPALMNTLLLALNSQYVHTNLAVRSLREYAAGRGFSQLALVEYTINHPLDLVLEEVYRQKPDLLLLSCYIWNIRMMEELAAELHRLLPGLCIVAGGPEVSYDAEAFLIRQPAVDMVLRGEGEEALCQLLEYREGRRPLEQVANLSWRDGSAIRHNPTAPLLDLAALPFPYPDLEDCAGRILYFETIRGCPFRCSYCLSSIAGPVRYLPLELALPRLQRFLDARVKQVKFVDRTFNCSRAHAMAIWKYLAEHDNGVTNFHFEITAHLMDDEMIAFLSTVRPGLFQFEIGVQSTNPNTITAIRRTTDTPRLLDICRRLDAPRNIHLHLDLIAGLPHEGLASFCRSFDDVMSIRPQQLQLGFLKVLKGSHMADCTGEYGLITRQSPPFQVLQTRWLSFDEMLQLQGMEEMVDHYYNSGLFARELELLLSREASAADFFLEMGRWWRREGYHLLRPSLEERYTLLGRYAAWRQGDQVLELLRECCRFDLCCHDRPRKLPRLLQEVPSLPLPESASRLLHDAEALWQLLPHRQGQPSKEIAKQVYLQRFACHPLTGAPGPVDFLFDPAHRDLLGRALAVEVALPED